MEKITSVNELRESILMLEIKRANEKVLLNEQFRATYECLKPASLIRNTLTELITAPNFKEDIFNTTLGMATGYLSKKAVIGSTHNPLKKLLGAFLQMGVTNIVSKNSDGIKSVVMHTLNNIFSKRDASA